ncbi:hypothetical protein DDI_2653 [Dickeya dianthicola RNS04.9]|nr:hypothetical protein DDI_2653 [Dickeya dianthicola RNS04.9]
MQITTQKTRRDASHLLAPFPDASSIASPGFAASSGYHHHILLLNCDKKPALSHAFFSWLL